MGLEGWFALGLAACNGGTLGVDDSDVTADSDNTDTDRRPQPAAAAVCTPQVDNALRVDCTVTLTRSSRAEIRFRADSDAERVLTDDSPALTQHFSLYGLLPKTTYTFDVDADDASTTGTFTTGALPDTLAELIVSVSAIGQPVTQNIAFPLNCSQDDPYLLIMDVQGRIRWYERERSSFTGSQFGVQGFNVTPERTLMAIMGDRLVEVGLDGQTRLDVETGIDFDRPIHHDVFRTADGRTLVLNAALVTGPDGNDYVVDGVYVLNPAGEVETSWDLRDHLDLSRLRVTTSNGNGSQGYWGRDYPGAIDFSHGNAISVGPDGNWILSFRWIDTVMSVDGHIGTAGFGNVRWTLVGGPENPLDADMALLAAPGVESELGFDGQHDAQREANGDLTLFDNQNGSSVSRIVRFAIDEDAHTAEMQEVHYLDAHCSIHGGVEQYPDGSWLATCADRTWFYEFPPGDLAGPAWTMQVACGGSSMGGTGTIRALPITFE